LKRGVTRVCGRCAELLQGGRGASTALRQLLDEVDEDIQLAHDADLFRDLSETASELSSQVEIQIQKGKQFAESS
jgi:hypothetical protein